MPAIHIRNVPEPTLSALRERADKRGHSMQQELLTILENAAAEPVEVDAPSPIQLVTARTAGQSTWSREEIYDEADR